MVNDRSIEDDNDVWGIGDDDDRPSMDYDERRSMIDNRWIGGDK